MAPDYVIVAPSRLRRIAARLQRALDLTTPHNVVWFDDEFNAKIGRLSPTSRVIFLGPSKYGDFMRRVVAPRFDEVGASWGMVQRKALIWTNDEEGDEISVERKLESARSRSKPPPPTRTLASKADPPSGKQLAGKFLSEPGRIQPDLDEEKYILGTAMFLLDGFEELHASVDGES